MALARSASGPGGLSINTGSANSLFAPKVSSPQQASGSIFGASSSKPPATGGLFGSNTMSTAPQSQSLFGASQSAQISGGMFGGLSSTPLTTQAGGGLFGSTTATNVPQQSGGLFGSSNTTQPQQTGSVFGSTSNPTQLQQSTGLFGNLGAQSTPIQGGTVTGLFGSNPAPQQTQQSVGLFGNLNNQNQSKPSGSLFGGLGASQNQQPQQQPSGGLFSSLGKPAQLSNNSSFGNTLGGGLKMGQSQGPTLPGVRIDVSQMRGTTRFNDLHEEVQKEIENIDKIIVAQQALSSECDAILPSHNTQLSAIPIDVDFLSRKLIGVESSLEGDAEATALVGQLVKQDTGHAKLSFKAIDNLKLPPQYHQSSNWMGKSASVGPSSQGQDLSDPQDLVSFFAQTADDMSSTLAKYQNYITEIELHLRTVEAATMAQAQQLNSHGTVDDVGEQKRELAAVLREFESGIRSVAGVVAEAREGVNRIQIGGFIDGVDGKKADRTKRSGIY